MKTNSKEEIFIPSNIYNRITKQLPIASVEALIVMDNALLFLKRKNHPAKDQWWFPGGRIRKGESLIDALRREIREETGLEITSCKLINVYSRVFPERHDITIAYLCKCPKSTVILNDEHSEYGLFRSFPVGLNSYLLETIKDSQWKSSVST